MFMPRVREVDRKTMQQKVIQDTGMYPLEDRRGSRISEYSKGILKKGKGKADPDDAGRMP